MSDKDKKPIVIKRIKKVVGGHHGGAWKIAYADFVTAMMAFFLLMWLLGSTAKGDLEGIAEYFRTPLKVALQGGSGSGDASSIIKGGGKDLTRKEGQVAKTNEPQDKKTINLEAARAELERLETEKLKNLKARLEQAIDANPNLRQFKRQLLLDITTEGLRIQIVDEKNRPMFDLAGAELKPYTRAILHEIGAVLNDVTNRISLSGHTDAAKYSSGERGYSNWELSSDRANASRRELIAGGMNADKMLRVVGLSSSVLFNQKDPLDPINRRISIIVLNKKTEEAITKDEGRLEVQEGKDVQQALAQPALPAAQTPAAPAPAAH
ncbi:MAG: flagellar motor protein MotB [Hydrogenophilaceae bacterium]|nr:flagellar motor protein MotB [Hydrogenophilaceae bacterium]